MNEVEMFFVLKGFALGAVLGIIIGNLFPLFWESLKERSKAQKNMFYNSHLHGSDNF